MLHVVGVSGNLNDLPPSRRELLARARIIVAGRRFLALLEEHPALKIPLTSPVEEALAQLKDRIEEEIVILVSGDPLFYGLGRKLCATFPPETLNFYPAPSSFQEAFARLKIPWEDAKLVSLHARAPKNLHLEIAPYAKVAFFTDHVHHPGAIAAYLLEKGVEGEVFVCENLGLAEEKIVHLPLSEVPQRTFAPLNVMVLLKRPRPRRLLFALPERHYQAERGLITKAEVRAVVVSALAPFPEATVWDLGAGSGAVGLELAGLCFRGEAFLVERNKARVEIIKENLARSKLDNVHVLHERISQALPGLPRPDLIFVGGGWSELLAQREILFSVLRPGVRLVGTFITFEPLLEALKFFEQHGFETHFSSLWVARGKGFPQRTHGLSALNPVFILRAKR